jgi:hypothetical protein
MGNLIVKKDDRVELKPLLRADDALISGADIAFAGMAIAGETSDVEAFAPYLISIAHLVTRIVLSERLIFAYSPGAGAEEPPTSHVLPLIEAHCATIQIDQDNQLISAVVEDTLEDAKEMFGEDLFEETLTSSRAFAPWSDGDTRLASGLLAEYAVANLLEAPFAPNPILSYPISMHAKRGRTSGDLMLRYVEDLRRETAGDMNLLEGMHVYDLDVPAIFGKVLLEARDPADLIRVAAQVNSEAKAFRAWCRNLNAKKKNPKAYLEELKAARASLQRLGKTLSTGATERMQVTVPTGTPLDIKVPSSTLKKLVDYLDVDVRFYRPRSFLLNLLSSANQIERLAAPLQRVFGLKPEFAREASQRVMAMALDQQAYYESRMTPRQASSP